MWLLGEKVGGVNHFRCYAILTRRRFAPPSSQVGGEWVSGG